MVRLAFLATAWGPKHGGVNAFNADLARAVVASSERGSVEVLCLVPTEPDEYVRGEAFRSGVTLISCPPLGKNAVPGAFGAFRGDLRRINIKHVDWWIGHDIQTGHAALAAAQELKGKAAIIHHTSYLHFSSVKHRRSAPAQDRAKEQGRLFAAADRVLGIGPFLADQARVRAGSRQESVVTLHPGLPDWTRPATNWSELSGIILGRLGKEDEPVKQSRLAVAAFATACKKARGIALLEHATLKVIGIDPAEEDEVRGIGSKYAGSALNLITLPFVESREQVARELSQASLALMPSWHEGFGLSGWEAIGAGLPLILGTGTGLYRMLKEELQPEELECCYPVKVAGTTQSGTFLPRDVKAISERVKEIAADLPKAARRATRLRQKLSAFTWSRTANELADALDISKVLRRQLSVVIAHSAPKVQGIQVSGEFRDEDPNGAQALLLLARRKYWDADFDSCYTLSSRAAEIFRQYGRGGDCLVALTEALSASRPQRWGLRLRKCILKAERCCATQKVPRRGRWLFLDRLALVLFDYARLQKAAQVMELASRLQEKLIADPDVAMDLRFDLANSQRRSAVIRGAARSYKPGESIQTIISEVLEYSTDFEKAGNLNFLVTSLAVASKLLGEVAGDRERAHVISQRALQYAKRVDHSWALQEHLLSEAEYFLFKGDEPRALDALVAASHVQEKAPVILEPVFDGTKKRTRDVRSIMETWGIPPERLAERDVVLQPRLVASSLRLSDKAIDRVVVTLMQTD